MLTDTDELVWPAAGFGECPICGHEWRRGEVIGVIFTRYEQTEMGAVRRNPGNRVVDALCVDRKRNEGDFTMEWAREAGIL